MLVWHLLPFSSLSLDQLYDLLQLRSAVFIVELENRYLDPDGWDRSALHLLGYEDGRLLAYARLSPPGTKRPEAVLSRLAIAAGHRGRGLGSQLVEKRLAYLREHHPGCAVFTQARDIRKPYYEKLGFVTLTDPYDDGGMLHVDMRLASV